MKLLFDCILAKGKYEWNHNDRLNAGVKRFLKSLHRKYNARKFLQYTLQCLFGLDLFLYVAVIPCDDPGDPIDPTSYSEAARRKIS